jgi:hypothetical protein
VPFHVALLQLSGRNPLHVCAIIDFFGKLTRIDMQQASGSTRSAIEAISYGH